MLPSRIDKFRAAIGAVHVQQYGGQIRHRWKKRNAEVGHGCRNDLGSGFNALVEHYYVSLIDTDALSIAGSSSMETAPRSIALISLIDTTVVGTRLTTGTALETIIPKAAISALVSVADRAMV